jgi:RNA polymerase sigma-70 factor (ECF subfamily)
MKGICTQANQRREAIFFVEKSMNQAEEAGTTAFPEQSQDEWFLRKTFEQDARQGCSLLFRKYYVPLCSHTVRYVYSKEIAEDIVAQVFCDLWENRLYEQVHFSYRAFLYRMVRNRAVDWLRKELGKNRLENLVALSLETPQLLPEQLMLYDELVTTIQEAVEALPPQCKKVFLLSRFEGQKNQEIAEHLQLSKRTVETHISKALFTLRQVLKQVGFGLLFLLAVFLPR